METWNIFKRQFSQRYYCFGLLVLLVWSRWNNEIIFFLFWKSYYAISLMEIILEEYTGCYSGNLKLQLNSVGSHWSERNNKLSLNINKANEELFRRDHTFFITPGPNLQLNRIEANTETGNKKTIFNLWNERNDETPKKLNSRIKTWLWCCRLFEFVYFT